MCHATAMELKLNECLCFDVCDDKEQPLGHLNGALINFKTNLNCCFMFNVCIVYKKFDSLIHM